MQGIQEYAKRPTPYIKFQMIEVANEKAPRHLKRSGGVDREGARGRTLLAHVIVLAIGGHLWSSEELAAELDRLCASGSRHATFVIGGSHGLSEQVLRRVQAKLFFGRLRLPHQLMRLVLVEQIYRAVKINRGGNRITSRAKFSIWNCTLKVGIVCY